MGDAVKMPECLERAAPGHLAVLLGKQASPRKSGLFVRHLCRCFPEVFAHPWSLAALVTSPSCAAETSRRRGRRRFYRRRTMRPRWVEHQSRS